MSQMERDMIRSSGEAMLDLLCQLAGAAKRRNGKPIISSPELLRLWELNRVRVLIAHEVPFSLECQDCDGIASGDGIDSLDKAIGLGWTEFEPAFPDNGFSHFMGVCPEHTAERRKDAKREARQRRNFQRSGAG